MIADHHDLGWRKPEGRAEAQHHARLGLEPEAAVGSGEERDPLAHREPGERRLG